MSSPTAGGRDLEGRLRAVLQAEADGLTFETPEHFDPGPSPDPDSGRGRWPWGPRLTMVVAGVGTAAAAILLALLLQDDVYDTATTVEDHPGGESQTSTNPAVPGAAGSRWLTLDLHGVTPTGADRYTQPGAEQDGQASNPAFQAFRTDAGFDGPTVWVESVRAGDSFGLGQDNPDADEVTIQGSRAYLSEEPDGSVRLGWPGEDDGGFYMTAAHIAAEDVVDFAEGLRPRSDGEGWEATALPQGLNELDLDEPAREEYEYAEWSYEGPDLANYELFVYEGGAGVFEGWAREHASSNGNVEEISVGGRPGLLIDDEDESIVVFRPTENAVVDFRTNQDPLTALEALRPVTEQEWLDHFPPGIRP